jgi:hypothetical protein
VKIKSAALDSIHSVTSLDFTFAFFSGTTKPRQEVPHHPHYLTSNTNTPPGSSISNHTPSSRQDEDHIQSRRSTAILAAIAA